VAGSNLGELLLDLHQVLEALDLRVLPVHQRAREVDACPGGARSATCERKMEGAETTARMRSRDNGKEA